jgi:nucleoside-diphosphate-sugar epimerase
MKFLISGGAGYLGAVLVGQLLHEYDDYDDEIIVLDNFSHGVPSLAHLCVHDRLKIIRGDVRDMQVVKPLLCGADVFIPLAALVGAPLCEARYQDAWNVNCYAVRDAMKLMSAEQRIVIPISNSGYGVGESGKECTEDTPMRPISVYGQTKVDVEKAVLDRGNAISLRLATVFGMSPRMRMDLLVNDFCWKALRDRAIVLFEAHFKRNYIHIRDVAEAFIHALDHFDAMKDKPYNVGLSDANLSKLELCECIKKHVPELTIMEAPIGEDRDKRDYIVDNSRIEGTRWHPQFSLDDGIRELITGYQMFKAFEHGNV